MKHPSHGAGVVMSNEASNHKAAPFPQLSWRDEATIISLVAESASPSSSSTKTRVASAVVLPHVGRESAW